MKDVATSSELLIFLKTFPPVDPDVIVILHQLPCSMMQKNKKTPLIISRKGAFFTLERTRFITVFTVLPTLQDSRLITA